MSSPIYFESLGQKTKESVIEELRYYFQMVSNFGSPGSTISMPLIREAYGTDIRNWPAVFVKILSSRTQTLGLGGGFVQDVWSDDQTIYQQYLPGTENKPKPKAYQRRVIAERYGYLSDISFQLQVWASKTPVRNRMVDEITAAFMRYQKERLLKKGIAIVSVDEGEESDFPLNDTTHIFVANITLVVNAELYFDYPVSSITDVNVKSGFNPNPNPDQPYYIEQIDPI